jgi:spermidine synthase
VARTLVALALVSGGAALVYEAVWLRWFRLLFGNTAYAASATLSAFFAGMALGALWLGRRAGRTRRPLVVYAAIEAGTALTALLVPVAVTAYEPIYAFLYDRLADHRSLFVAIKFALALLAVIPTATLLGGTLPMLATALVPDGRDAGRRVGALYACNTLGAALGSAAGSLWLPDALGVRATYGVAMALSLGVASVAAILSLRVPALARPAAADAPVEVAADRRWIAIGFLSGFGVLAFEVLLIQTLALAVESSVYSFGAVLIVVLLTLGLSAGVVSGLPARAASARTLSVVLLVEGALLLMLPALIVLATGGLAAHAPATFANGVRLAIGFGGLPLLVGGLVLPMVFRLAEGGPVGPRLGGLLAANTVGGIAGSVVASFVLLDGLGLWPSMFALAALYAGAGVALLERPRARGLAAAAVCVFAAGVLVTGADPWRLPVERVRRQQRIVASEEGAHGVVSVVDVMNRRLERDRWLRVDGRYTLSGALARVHQERLGHLPLVVHGSPKRVLYVGTATGETASAAVLHPLDRITLVELVPEVQRLAARHFAALNRGVYDDPRTRVVVEDGRNHIRATHERYDAIVMDLFVPQRPGVGSMYTRGSFTAAAARLTPGGVLCVWLPLYQLDDDLFQVVAATFVEAFPDAMLWRGDFFTSLPTAALIGFAGDPPAASTISSAGRALREHDVDDRWLVDPRGLWMLYLGALRDALDPAAPRRVNTDDQPSFEYLAARSDAGARARFRLGTWPALAEHVLRASEGRSPARPAGSAAASRAMARAQQLVVGRESPRWAEAAALLRRDVPQELLEVPDRNVAEAWPTGGEAARTR